MFYPLVEDALNAARDLYSGGFDDGRYLGNPNVVLTENLNPDDLRDLLDDTRLVLGKKPDPGLIERHVNHESEHLYAARQVGSTVSTFGVRVSLVKKSGVVLPTYNPFFRHTPVGVPDLAIAAITGHPAVPSKLDRAKISEVSGHESIKALGDDIAEHNRTHSLDSSIPLPLSYSPSMSVRRLLSLQ